MSTTPLNLGALIRAVIIAGAVAALLTSAFHLAVSERYLDRAITLDDQARMSALAASGATSEHHDEVFSRRTQKVGLLAGTLLYGLGAGAVFAGVYTLIAPRLPGGRRRTQIAVLAGATVIAIALIPFLKYPANPPGVGEPETLARRQLLYVSCLLLSIAGLALGGRVYGTLRTRLNQRRALAVAALFTLGWLAALVLLLPDRTDPVTIPARLLWQFRFASLAGQLLFWGLFAWLFATELERGEAPAVATARS